MSAVKIIAVEIYRVEWSEQCNIKINYLVIWLFYYYYYGIYVKTIINTDL